MGCILLMVISSEFSTGQYRADDHQEDAPQFNLKYYLTGDGILFYFCFHRIWAVQLSFFAGLITVLSLCKVLCVSKRYQIVVTPDWRIPISTVEYLFEMRKTLACVLYQQGCFDGYSDVGDRILVLVLFCMYKIGHHHLKNVINIFRHQHR